MKNTVVQTGKVRFSYVHAFEPKVPESGGDPKYSVTLLIPKQDKKTLNKIKEAMANACLNFKEKNPGKKLPANLKNTLHDGDQPKESGEDFGPECKGHYVMTVSSKTRPGICYADKKPMTETSELYSGCYGRAAINAYVYNTNRSIGISFGLNGLMKLEDGEPLAGTRFSAEDWDDDYDDYEVDDFGSMLD